MAVAGRRREFLDDFAGLRVGQEQIDPEEVAAAEERDQLAVGAERRRNVVIAAPLERDQRLADAVRMRSGLRDREKGRLRCGGPILRERIAVLSEHANERLIPAESQ